METLSASLAKQVSPEHRVKNINTNASESFKLPHHKLMSQSFASDIESNNGNGIKLPTSTISDERMSNLQKWGRLKESGFPLPEDNDDQSTSCGESPQNSDSESDTDVESTREALTRQLRDQYRKRMVAPETSERSRVGTAED